jgi:hypothetical protein
MKSKQVPTTIKVIGQQYWSKKEKEESCKKPYIEVAHKQI